MTGTPYTVLIGGVKFTVRNRQLQLGEQVHDIDDPMDLLKVDARVTADFGKFTLTVWRTDDGGRRYQGAAEGITGPEDSDEERALWGLLKKLGDERAPKACFFCRWSDVEPSTGWGNMGCAVKQSAAYHEVATTTDNRRRKWGPSALFGEWVDEWFSCEKFEVRPVGYGYRGRTG